MKKTISVSFKIDREYLEEEFDEEWSAEKIFKYLLSGMVVNEMQICASDEDIFKNILQDLKITEE